MENLKGILTSKANHISDQNDLVESMWFGSGLFLMWSTLSIPFSFIMHMVMAWSLKCEYFLKTIREWYTIESLKLKESLPL